MKNLTVHNSVCSKHQMAARDIPCGTFFTAQGEVEPFPTLWARLKSGDFICFLPTGPYISTDYGIFHDYRNVAVDISYRILT